MPLAVIASEQITKPLMVDPSMVEPLLTSAIEPVALSGVFNPDFSATVPLDTLMALPEKPVIEASVNVSPPIAEWPESTVTVPEPEFASNIVTPSGLLNHRDQEVFLEVNQRALMTLDDCSH